MSTAHAFPVSRQAVPGIPGGPGTPGPALVAPTGPAPGASYPAVGPVSAALHPPTARADSDAVVLTHGLTKAFGRRTVVDSLDLVVPRGTVYGFLGPNGSGKSTTMKMLLGLLAPTRGQIAVLGQPFNTATRPAIMARTGSMIESPPGYGHLTGAENMRIAARMLGLSDRQVDRALALVRLSEHKDRLVRTYSLGMKQRLGVALALVREPELLILDEPTNGLDPAGIEEVRRLLVELAGEGVTVMVSSHLLDEIDRMASVLGILSGGRMVFQGTRAQLMERSVPDVLVVTPTPRSVLDPRILVGLLPDGVPGPGALAGQQDAGPRLTPEGVLLPGLSNDAVAELIGRLAAAGVALHEVRRQAQSLEDVFMDLTGRGGVL
ncbi:ABC transporter ATP-binding protein [Actinomyces bowdenii]|uniref:ABC transporter ATP-binding protein n=1 Tax=Actinomyces bowdenii TaxID=131109 RepID=A0A853EL73_9ACTO|nr:ABC transporter ATP-binding protein [Actinomyces bowdenii]MBF0697900.1 ABC transporter ATP-binding protein [Actinomyces bowdenii]NYS70073.1 ABC transporter ATP-binding protein [Actinomyces bowdenii]